MQDDINKQLTFEIKKEMADRYFGFRKLIEEDIQEYGNQVFTSFRRLEQKIGFDLVRLYILLKDEDLIHEFFQLAGLEERIFYDPYLTESQTLRKKVFAGQKIRGLTRAGRFKNMIFDTYDALVADVDEYRRNLMKLADERETIAEEINQFYHKHDLGTMMDFLRGLDGSEQYKSGSMEGGIIQQSGQQLDEKMKVKPPPPVEELLPAIPPIAPLAQIKGRLKKIIERAYKLHNHLDLKEIAQS
ncbi:MAG: hypothetical protein M8357_01075 [Desulfobulbaceae bacterium]|nr:hypothetical protein [Desulfobulbaceae bacterium]